MMKLVFSLLSIIMLLYLVDVVSVFWVFLLYLTMAGGAFNFSNLSLAGFNFMGYGLMMDFLSFGLIVLSFWITILMYMASYSTMRNFEGAVYFGGLIMFLFLILCITFFVSNYLLFYFFFEASLIPTLMIIVGWGYQPERLQAGIYFLFYTLSVSLPLLLLIVWTGRAQSSFSFWSVGAVWSESLFISILLVLGLTGAFLVKMPMFFVHLWLPKAHVEAPVAGSMILAGVLLKLGGYGLIRVLHICVVGVSYFSFVVYSVGLLGMLYVGLMCCRLNDFKALVAYSSVAHMALVICGVGSLLSWGFNGSLMMMISHGLASSGLFCIVNMYYERLGSRSFYFNRGLILVLPIFCLLIFLLSAANISAPPTINLLSEIFLMANMLSYDTFMMIIFPFGSFLGAVFTLFMFSYSQHGKSYYLGYSYLGVEHREIHSLVLHIVPVNFLFLKSDFYLLAG
uniref:NADH-ubiquinone oxidoreductase chain 4 n=1 Tax=Kaylathalia klovstadi TaxID=2778773 RepID=A0A7T6Y703_9HEXA|nr:NADH dehydrogenase subunit 4 [Kaylathalia klovstadi]QQK54739.1 NADH dehydrogenase subunit 4 [Kaylathalia klovstadi]